MEKSITGSTFWHFSPLFPISPHFHLASPLFLFHPHATESEGEMFGQMRVKKEEESFGSGSEVHLCSSLSQQQGLMD